MKKALKIFLLFLLISSAGYSQHVPYQVPRSSPQITAGDARLRATMTFGLPNLSDTTLNGGLDSLGSMIYVAKYRAVFVRDTVFGLPGHKWTNINSLTAGLASLNGLTNSTQTFATGTAGTNFNIVSAGSVHTFNIPIASATNTGLLSNTFFTAFNNKVNVSDTSAMLAPYLRSLLLNVPASTFSSTVTVLNHVATATVAFNNQSNNVFLAGPSSGGVGPVSWRGLTNNDLPVSSVTAGSYTNSNITVNQQGIITNISNGTGGGGGGGVSSVGMTVPAAFSVSPSTITTSGVFAISATGSTAQYINGAGGLTTFPNIPAQVNIVGGSGITVSGTYPNLTITSTSGGGSVTTFSAGTLSPLFTTSVSNATTTPNLTFTATAATSYTLFGNNSGTSAVPTFFAPSLASNLFQNQGTTTTVLHGNAAGNPSWAAVSLSADVTGNLPVTRLNSGTGASSSTYWRGDGTWATVSGSGTVTSVAVSSTDLSVSGSPITGSGTFTLNVNSNAITYAKFQQVAANSLVGNPTGSTANAQGIPIGLGLKFSAGVLVVDTASLHDTLSAVNGLQYLGSTGDSIGLGGTLYQNTTVATGTNILTFNTNFGTLNQTNGNAAYTWGTGVTSALFSYRLDYINAAGTHNNAYTADTLGDVLFGQNVTVNGGFYINSATSSASSYTVTRSNIQVFSGSSATTWTMPTILSTAGIVYQIKNRGSATITLNAAGSDHFYSTSSVSTLSITAGNSVIIANDAGFWEVIANSTGGGAGISLTTTGSSGAATLTGSVLNIPIYAGGSSTLTRQNITTGTTATGTTGGLLVKFNFSSTASTFTFTMPASPTDQQVVEFEGGGTLTTGTEVTSLTVSPNSGQTIIGSVALTTFTVGEYAKYKYDATLSIWYREN